MPVGMILGLAHLILIKSQAGPDEITGLKTAEGED